MHLHFYITAISKSMEAAGDGHAFPVFPENSSFSMRPRQINEHWSNPTEQLQVWTPTHHVCYRPLTVYHIHLQNFSINSLAECKSRNKASSPPGMVRSITSMDLSVSDVSSNLFRRIIVFKSLFPNSLLEQIPTKQGKTNPKLINTSASCFKPVILYLNSTLQKCSK